MCHFLCNLCQQNKKQTLPKIKRVSLRGNRCTEWYPIYPNIKGRRNQSSASGDQMAACCLLSMKTWCSRRFFLMYIVFLFCFWLMALCLTWKLSVLGLQHQNRLPLCWCKAFTNPTSHACALAHVCLLAPIGTAALVPLHAVEATTSAAGKHGATSQNSYKWKKKKNLFEVDGRVYSNSAGWNISVFFCFQNCCKVVVFLGRQLLQSLL